MTGYQLHADDCPAGMVVAEKHFTDRDTRTTVTFIPCAALPGGGLRFFYDDRHRIVTRYSLAAARQWLWRKTLGDYLPRMLVAQEKEAV